MAQITFDTEDSAVTLQAIRDFIQTVAPVAGSSVPTTAHPEFKTGDVVSVDVGDGNSVESAVVITGNEESPTGTPVDDGVVEETTTAASTTEDATTDEHGVPFNADFCGKAKQPHYGSGKKKGQWKKRQGVSEEAYDEWYDSCLDDKYQEPEEEAVVDVGAAFGATTEDSAAEDDVLFTNPGELMGWTSEQQVAENITATQVGETYAALGVSPTDLWGGDKDKVAGLVQSLHSALKALI